MQFTINQKELKEALTFICSVVEKKSTIPVLETVLIEADSGNARFTGTDLDMFAIADTSIVPVCMRDKICVSAKALQDAVKGLSGDVEFNLDAERKWLHVSSGGVKYKFPTVDAEQFPSLPDNLPNADIGLSDLNHLVKHTEFAITKDMSRFTLRAIKLEIESGHARAIATDGHRLALADTDCDGEMGALVPVKAMKLAAKFGPVTVGGNDKYVRFVNCTKQLLTRQDTGPFPNYEMVLPRNNINVAEIDAATLTQAIKQASVTADDRNKAIKLRLSKGNLAVSSFGSDEGGADISLPVTYDGEEIVFGFNYQYLLDALKQVKGNVTFSFEDNNRQTEISHGKVRNVIMPLRD